MSFKPCRCLPPVEGAQYRACLGTGGICIYSLGMTEEEALRNLAAHAKKDRISRNAWVEAWIEQLDGKLVRNVDLEEVQTS